MIPTSERATWPADIPGLIAGGGRPLVDLLQFCVVSVQPEALFAALAREYRFRPTAAGAVALFDVFCAPNALFRLRVGDRLPPRDLALTAAIRPLRVPAPPAEPPPGEEPPPPVILPTPSRALFAALEEFVVSAADSPLTAMAAAYDPTRGPVENLPGGKMTASQRTFVNTVWLKRVRPTLVAAGYWRVATIGQP